LQYGLEVDYCFADFGANGAGFRYAIFLEELVLALRRCALDQLVLTDVPNKRLNRVNKVSPITRVLSRQHQRIIHLLRKSRRFANLQRLTSVWTDPSLRCTLRAHDILTSFSFLDPFRNTATNLAYEVLIDSLFAQDESCNIISLMGRHFITFEKDSSDFY
jgi:hypothetical protein